MGLADQLACEVVPCGVADDCLNSPQQRGEEQAECRHCKLANSGGGSLNYWRPWQRGLQHPKLIVEKREAGKARRAAAQEKRGKRDRAKMDVQRKARNAERQTNRSIIENTRNSGRIAKDGDHVSAGRIGLDTKMQSGNENPVVHLVELDKVREDARRGGNPIGGLVLRNKHGRGVVVFDEVDYSLLIGIIMRQAAVIAAGLPKEE
jgi:hypothetical protein